MSKANCTKVNTHVADYALLIHPTGLRDISYSARLDSELNTALARNK